MVEFRRDFMRNLSDQRRDQLVLEGTSIGLGFAIPIIPRLFPMIAENITPEFNRGILILGASLIGLGLVLEACTQAAERLPRVYRQIQTRLRRR